MNATESTPENVPMLLYPEMYRRMLRIRRFEEMAVELAARGEIAGALHTATGQEGEIVGACMALAIDDYMVGNHRSHGHPIGKGAKLNGLMAELLGRETGVNRGKGGSMHLADFSVGSLGETSIVGSGLPVATGAALGAKMQKSGRVSLCFFGDGASCEGTFHESLNIAALWKLPVIFLCENNGYAITTPIDKTVSVADVAVRAAGYGIPGVVVDGQDVLVVYHVVSEAVRRARAGEGPTLVEAKTYRFNDHAAAFKGFYYRSDAEVERWRLRDPIALFRKYLLAHEIVSPGEIAACETEVAAEAQAAVLFGLGSRFPAAVQAYEHVFLDPLIPLRG